MKTYIIFYDGRIGYIKNICKCSSCVKRKQYEWLIYNLNDEYMDCTIPEDESKYVLYIGENLAKAIDVLNSYYKNKLSMKDTEVKYLQSVCDVYKKELFG